MRNLSFSVKKCDKKYILAFIITLLCAIVCGIVLYKPVTTNVYFINFANDYVYNVFNFKNTPIFFTHFLADLLYFYVFFLICYATKLKYLTLVFVYLKGLFFGIYAVILICVCAVGGVIVAIFVFIPATVLSFAICCIITEICKNFDKKYAFFVPLVLALLNGIILMLLINVLFRVVIIIV